MRELERVYRDAKRTVVLAFCLLGTAAMAQSGGPYEMVWSTIDGGGGLSRGE